MSEVIHELKNIRLNDRQIFTKKEEQFFKAAKDDGFEAIYSAMMEKVPSEKKTTTQVRVFTKTGDIIYKRLHEKGALLKHIPVNDVNIIPKDRGFVVSFDALLREKTSFGTVHYSPLKPKISVNGIEYIVAFTKHAIERICERSVYAISRTETSRQFD